MQLARDLGALRLARIVHARRQLPQLFFRLAQASLRFDKLGDVVGDPLDGDHLAGAVVDRHASMLGVHDCVRPDESSAG